MASTRPASPESPSTSKHIYTAVEPSYPALVENDLPTYPEINRQLPVEYSLPSSTPGFYIPDEGLEQLRQDEENLLQIYDGIQKDAQTVVSQASSLADMVPQLRQAMAVIETQRSESRAF